MFRTPKPWGNVFCMNESCYLQHVSQHSIPSLFHIIMLGQKNNIGDLIVMTVQGSKFEEKITWWRL